MVISVLSTIMTKPRRGFNLIEAAIVLGVVGIVIGGIWVAASAVDRNRKISRAIEQVFLVTDKISKTFQNVDLTGQQLFFHGNEGSFPKSAWSAFLPPDMVGSEAASITSAPKNPWGLRTLIGLYGPSGPVESHIEFDIEIPDAATCTQLSTRLASVLSARLISVGGSPLVYTLGELVDVTTLENAASICKLEFETSSETRIIFNVKL